MIPTLNQSKCLRMLEEWARSPMNARPVESLPDGGAIVTVTQWLTVHETDDYLTKLVLLAHRDGLTVVIRPSGPFLEVIVRVPAGDPPSLTILRRHAHKGRLLGAYAHEKGDGK